MSDIAKNAEILENVGKSETTKSDAEAKAFGLLLEKLIGQMGMSQKDLAISSRTTQPTISGLINGHRQCSIKMAIRLAEALKLTGDDRVQFVSKANQPRWKGFTHDIYGGEAMFSESVASLLSSSGVKTTDILTVSTIESKTGENPSIILVMKDGEVYDINMDIRKRPSVIRNTPPPPSTESTTIEVPVIPLEPTESPEQTLHADPPAPTEPAVPIEIQEPHVKVDAAVVTGTDGEAGAEPIPSTPPAPPTT
jgi:Helix-turn-helix